MKRVGVLSVLTCLLGLALGCPGPIIDRPPDVPLQPANHSTNANMVGYRVLLEGTTGVGRGTVGNRGFLLAGTVSGLAVLPEDPGWTLLTVSGPLADLPALGIQRDAEAYQGYAYVCSNTLGTREGVMIVDLRELSQNKATYLRSLLPHDGNPRGNNLSIDQASGFLYLQRSSGVEVWSLAPDPAQPVYVASFAPGVPVSDLVVQGGYAYLSEGSANAFSLWSVLDPAHPALVERWAARGFARSIWPDETGNLIGTAEENATAPVRFWTRSPSAGILQVGSWSFGDGTAPYSIKLSSQRAVLGHGQAGMLVLDHADPSRPSVRARFDGPMPGGEPALRDVWDVLPSSSGGVVFVSDRQNSLIQVMVH